MRKFYVLGAMLAITFSNAQTAKKSFFKKSETGLHKPFVSNLKESSIKFQQAADFDNAIISMVDQDDAQIIAADDFQLTEAVKVDKFVFYGTQDYDDLPDYLLGAKMYIFNDDNGKPAGTPTNASNAVAAINLRGSSAIAISTENPWEFTIDVNVTQALGQTLTLDANKRYWVAFAPIVDLGDEYGADSSEIFYWAGTPTGNFAEPVLIDEEDLFQAGATDWSTISDLTGDPMPGMAFSITGETALGTGEVYSNRKNVSVYPNPAVSIVNVKANGKHAITKTEIYDMNGKLVTSSASNSIDVEKLPKAVYLVKVYAGSEVIETTKLIKK